MRPPGLELKGERRVLVSYRVLSLTTFGVIGTYVGVPGSIRHDARTGSGPVDDSVKRA